MGNSSWNWLVSRTLFNSSLYRACFKTYGFRMRVKADTYNDETRLKHSVVDASDLEFASYCRRLIQVEFILQFGLKSAHQEIENGGYSDLSIPAQVELFSRNIREGWGCGVNLNISVSDWQEHLCVDHPAAAAALWLTSWPLALFVCTTFVSTLVPRCQQSPCFERPHRIYYPFNQLVNTDKTIEPKLINTGCGSFLSDVKR